MKSPSVSPTSKSLPQVRASDETAIFERVCALASFTKGGSCLIAKWIAATFMLPQLSVPLSLPLPGFATVSN